MSDLALNYFLQDNEHHDDEAPMKADVEDTEEEQINIDEMASETPIELLRSMYQRDEDKIQNRQLENKQKIKLKAGHVVDVFSSSKNKWMQGIILYIDRDTFCVLYGNKKKWLHKTSTNFRLKSMNKESPKAISPLSQSLSPRAAFSSAVIVHDSPQVLSSPAIINSSSSDSIKSASNKSALFSTYDVVFDSESIGLSFIAAQNGRNCVVYQCLNKFAFDSVKCGSMITAINGRNVMHLQYSHIMEIMEQNAHLPPLTLTFSKSNAALYEAESVNYAGWKMDTLSLAKSANMRALIENEGELYETVICSQKIKKVNRKRKTQERVLVITNKALYYLKYAKKSQRRIAIRDVQMVTLANSSNEFVIHVPLQYDAHFIAGNKAEIVLLLEELYFQETIDNLLVVYSDMKHLNDIVLNRKMSLKEKRISKLTIKRSISRINEELDDL